MADENNSGEVILVTGKPFLWAYVFLGHLTKLYISCSFVVTSM